MKFTGDNHSGEQLTTGVRAENNGRLKTARAGAIVSYLREERAGTSPVPSFVLLSPPMADGPVFRDEFGPLYAGSGHRAFTPTGPSFEDLSLATGVTRERLADAASCCAVSTRSAATWIVGPNWPAWIGSRRRPLKC